MHITKCSFSYLVSLRNHNKGMISKLPGKCLQFAVSFFSGMAVPKINVTRFEGVAGLEQRKNDLFHASPFSSSDSDKEAQILVFFGGDVQVGGF